MGEGELGGEVSVAVWGAVAAGRDMMKERQARCMREGFSLWAGTMVL